ncbi:hypothetical protein B0T24DRAFT_590171 [Lasiosphaeria ovina]|uniref:Uncharacterized protein n=1 Tax=Lasiosphaeria ovina TaxID=92902 RepID=A0AAE0NDR5_9PEZI|nr:hypothetical protein B0T24DRAFT_590171 [Lasiosphaeria ovina]
MHHSGLETQIEGVKDLCSDRNKCSDDIIVKLSDANGTGEVPDAQSRDGLWKRVFSNGWNTNCPNIHPGPIRARRGVESMTQVGTWKVNLPAPSTPSKRKRNENVTPNAHRLTGAPAFIKPNMNWDDFGVSFSVCDAKGSGASAKYVALNPGWTLQQARAEAMMHWDEHEVERIIEYNAKLAVCFARSRLLALHRASGSGGTTLPQGSRPVGTLNEVAINTDDFVKLVTCADKMKEMATLVNESEKIASARPIKKKKLADSA